jgi:hypothetical protein
MPRKNLLKIPTNITEQIRSKPNQEWVAGCARTFTRQEIAGGCLAHLGVTMTGGVLQVPPAALPPANGGKYSRRNAQGYLVVRRDLPKDPNYKPHDVPSWGSRSSTHTVYLPHPRYPRDVVAPKLNEIAMVWSNRGSDSDQIALSFRVEEVFTSSDLKFESTLLSNLNLLQENVGACGMYPADQPIADYIRTLHVNWEILPPGTVDEVIARLFPGNSGTREERETAADRFAFFESLSAEKIVYGLSGNRRYFGAIMPSGAAVFENLHYGNAVYIFFSNWERLSQLSRIELLSGRQGRDVVRVPHMPGWQGTVRKIINMKLMEGA